MTENNPSVPTQESLLAQFEEIKVRLKDYIEGTFLGDKSIKEILDTFSPELQADFVQLINRSDPLARQHRSGAGFTVYYRMRDGRKVSEVINAISKAIGSKKTAEKLILSVKRQRSASQLGRLGGVDPRIINGDEWYSG